LQEVHSPFDYIGSPLDEKRLVPPRFIELVDESLLQAERTVASLRSLMRGFLSMLMALM